MIDKNSKIRITIGIIVIILMALVVGSIVHLQGKEKYNNLGVEEYQKGNHDKAIYYFNKAIESDPNNAVVYHNRGLVYFKMGSYYNTEPFHKAISDFSKAIELDPNYVDAYYNRGLAYNNLFHHYQKLPTEPFPPEIEDKYHEALADFDRVLELDPNYALAYAGKGNAYYRHEDSYEGMTKAIAEYDKALKSEDLIIKKVGKKGLAGVYYSRGRTYTYMEDLDKAISDYLKSLELEPELMMTIGHLAAIYLDQGQYDKALELSKKYVHLTETKGYALGDYAYMSRGKCYYHLKEYDKAISDFKKVIDDYDSHYEALAYRYLGMAYSEKGDDEKAKGYFEKAIELCTQQIDRGGITIPEAYYERGLTYMELKEYDRAIPDFKKVIELKSMSYREYGHENYYNEAHRSSGIAYSYVNETDKAKEYFEKAIELYKKPGGAKHKVEEVEELLNEL
ncbi:tetratricopeptide repeat protein [Methanophagales archaeon]|nr:MAG: tetratricopeptide repeat protein [Methanophagales archaeon]